MAKKDETPEGKSSARGRIMQVVEVEEESSSPAVHSVSPEKIKEEQISEKESVSEKKQDADIAVQEDENERPDIASSFPMSQDHQEKEEEESSIIKKEQSFSDQEKDQTSAIPPLKPEEKMDLVSELFETNRKPVEYPEISLEKKPSPFRFLIWVVILLVIVGFIGGGLWYLKQRSVSQESVSSEIVSSPTPTFSAVTETPVATPSGKIASPSASVSPTVKKTGLSVRILNGNGEKGVASEAKKFLEEKGYTVVSTGNADAFDYEETEIDIKEEKSSQLDKLKADVSEKYTVGSTTSDLKSDASYDVQIIIGKQ